MIAIDSTPLTRWAARSPRLRWAGIGAGLFLAWGLAGYIAPAHAHASAAACCRTAADIAYQQPNPIDERLAQS